MTRSFEFHPADVSMMAEDGEHDLEHDRIKRDRVYFEMPVLIEPLGVAPA